MDSGKEARAGDQGRRSGQGHKPKTEPGIQGKNSRHKLRTKNHEQDFMAGIQGRNSGQGLRAEGLRAGIQGKM